MESPRDRKITLTPAQLEQKYAELPDDIKLEYPKEQLLKRLTKINWSFPQERHGPLCLRTSQCSPDCTGGDCY